MIFNLNDENLHVELNNGIKDTFSNLFSDKYAISKETIDNMEMLRDLSLKTGRSFQSLAEEYGVTDKALLKYASATKVADMSVNGLQKSVDIANTKIGLMGIKAVFAQAKVLLLNAAVTMGISLLASLAITGAIKFFDNFADRTKKVAEAAKTAKENIDELSKSLSKKKKDVNDIKDRYAELAQGIDQLNNKNLSLSTEDYEEFLNLSNQLAEIFPDIQKGCTSNGDAILGLSGNVDTITSKLEKLIETEERMTNNEIVENLSSVFSGATQNLSKYQKELKKYEKELANIKYLEQGVSEYMNTFSHISDISNFGDGLGTIKFEYDRNSDYFQDLQEIQKAFGAINIDSNVFGDADDNSFYYYVKIDDSEIDNFKTKISDLSMYFNSEISKAETNIENVESNIKKEYNTIIPSIISYLKSNFQYLLLDVDLQSVVNDMVSNINWNELDISTWDDAQDYINNNILALFNNNGLTEELKESLKNAFDQADMSDSDYIKYVEDIQDKIQQYLNDNNIDIPFNLDFVINDKKDLQSRLSNRIGEITNYNIDESYDLMSFLNDNSIDTSDEIENFLKVTQSAKSATEMMNLYLESLKDVDKYSHIDLSPISEELDKIQSAYKTVSSAIEEYKTYQYLSLDTVQSLLELDDKYLSFLYDENGQLTLNTDSYNALTQAKLDEMEVSICVNALDTIESIKDEQTAADYLKQSTFDLTQAKWDDVAATIALAEADLQARKNAGEVVDEQMKALDQIGASTKAKVNILKEALNGLKYEPKKFYTGFDKSSSSKNSQTENEIDWIANSISNLNREIDNLNTKLENTNSFKDRLKVYDDLNKANKNLISSTKDAVKAYENVWNKKASKISSSYRQKIISGSTFSVESFKGKDDEYNLVTKAQKAYEQWQSSLQDYQKAIDQQNKDLDARTQLLVTQKELELDIVGINLDSAETTKYKNSLLKKEKSLKKELLQYNLSLAKTDEEKIKLQKEFNKYLKENADQQYENVKAEKENHISYWDSKISDYNNVLNTKDAQGSTVTRWTYDHINSALQSKIKWEQSILDAALEKRNSAKYGTEEWDKYNQEVQSCQDAIAQCTQEQIKNNKAIASIPINKLQEETDELQKQLELEQKKYDNIETSINAASSIIQDEIDYYNDLKEATEDSYDAQIKVIQDKIDALNEENDARQNQLSLEKAQYELEKAKNNKTSKIYKEGQGFVYEQDYDAVRNAQESYDEALLSNQTYKLNKQIQSLTDQKDKEVDILDKKIESLTTYQEHLNNITSNWEKIYNYQVLISLMGDDIISRIESGDYTVVTELSDLYGSAEEAITSTKEKIEQNQSVIDSATDFINSWSGAEKELSGILRKITDTIKNNAELDKAIDDKVDNVSSIATEWNNNNISIKESLDLLNKDYEDTGKTEEEILNNRLENIKKFSSAVHEELMNIQEEFSKIKDITAAKLEIESKLSTTKTSEDTKTTSNKNNVKSMGKSHSGMELGYIGDKASDKSKDSFKYIALDKLQPYEVPRLLRNGEAVLTPSQINNVMSNFNTSYIAGLQSIPKTKQDEITNVSFSGDIIINSQVSDVDSLAKAIKTQLPSKFLQELYK